jgi:hypothetical protein
VLRTEPRASGMLGKCSTSFSYTPAFMSYLLRNLRYTQVIQSNVKLGFTQISKILPFPLTSSQTYIKKSNGNNFRTIYSIASKKVAYQQTEHTTESPKYLQLLQGSYLEFRDREHRFLRSR